MTNAWQLYDPQGRPITSRGASKHEVAIQGLLHGTAHIWLWRRNGKYVEVLLQKRAAHKVTWPGLLDKSGGGHILFGESPLRAAARKVNEELGIELDINDLQFIGTTYDCTPVEDTGLVEHEFRWIYLCEVDDPALSLSKDEVDAVQWRRLSAVTDDMRHPRRRETYLPYGRSYFTAVIDGIKLKASQPNQKHEPFWMKQTLGHIDILRKLIQGSTG